MNFLDYLEGTSILKWDDRIAIISGIFGIFGREQYSKIDFLEGNSVPAS